MIEPPPLKTLASHPSHRHNTARVYYTVMMEWGMVESVGTPDMAAPSDIAALRPFFIGRAINKALGVFFRHIIRFGLLAIIIWVPIYFFEVKIIDYIVLLKMADQLSHSRQYYISMQYYYSLQLLIHFLTSLIFSAILLHATFQIMHGKPLKLTASLGRGFMRLLPVLGLSLLAIAGFVLYVFVLTMLGNILLFSNASQVAAVIVVFGLMGGLIFGSMIYVRWFVALPVCVIEKIGPFRSMRRSAQLTRGSRWKIFAYLLLFVIVGFAIAGGFIEVVKSSSLFFMNNMSLTVLFRTLLEALLGAFAAVTNAVIYSELRNTKEGLDVESVASVFD